MNKSGFSLTGLRRLVQALFVLVCLYIGYRFFGYYTYLGASGLSGSPYRPPGVEAFIPLSALVGLRAWLGTGIFDRVHPAGLSILLIVILVSFLFRKSFCSWICPFGFLEELLGRAGRAIFHRRLELPGWLDIPLRALKYILLALFTGSVFFMMNTEAASAFIESPYNKVVDIKMLRFFLHISLTGTLVFGFLIVISVLFEQFWCRYLCPYGALLGLFGWLSPSAIRRSENLCVNCGACDRACRGRLKVSLVKKVLSPECNACMGCVESCPVPGALAYTFAGKLGRFKYALPAAMLAVFVLAIIIARATGHWESSTTLQEVSAYFNMLDKI